MTIPFTQLSCMGLVEWSLRGQRVVLGQAYATFRMEALHPYPTSCFLAPSRLCTGISLSRLPAQAGSLPSHSVSWSSRSHQLDWTGQPPRAKQPQGHVRMVGYPESLLVEVSTFLQGKRRHSASTPGSSVPGTWVLRNLLNMW